MYINPFFFSFSIYSRIKQFQIRLRKFDKYIYHNPSSFPIPPLPDIQITDYHFSISIALLQHFLKLPAFTSCAVQSSKERSFKTLQSSSMSFKHLTNYVCFREADPFPHCVLQKCFLELNKVPQTQNFPAHILHANLQAPVQ